MSVIAEEQAQAKTKTAPGADRKFPTTSNELHQFVADSLQQLMSIPQNAAAIAISILGAQITGLRDSRELMSRQANKLVLVRVEYPGAFRATVVAAEEEGQPMSVSIAQRDKEGQWTAPVGYADNQLEALGRLVLSQTTVPGDVYYITTNQAVDDANEKASDMMMEQAKQIAEA